jgi:hypothetical protein
VLASDGGGPVIRRARESRCVRGRGEGGSCRPGLERRRAWRGAPRVPIMRMRTGRSPAGTAMHADDLRGEDLGLGFLLEGGPVELDVCVLQELMCPLLEAGVDTRRQTRDLAMDREPVEARVDGRRLPRSARAPAGRSARRCRAGPPRVRTSRARCGCGSPPPGQPPHGRLRRARSCPRPRLRPAACSHRSVERGP